MVYIKLRPGVLSMRNTFIRAGIIACLFSWLTLAYADQPESLAAANQEFTYLCSQVPNCHLVFS